MKNILITRDTHNKIRVLFFETEKLKDNTFLIHRKSGLLNGKLISQPDKIILKGKVKRTIEEQTKLEYDSLIKKSLDKGYKDITTFGYSDLNFDIESILPKNITDQNGIIKPMLCKIYDPSDKKSQNIEYFSSPKLDGVRCFLYYKDGNILSKSRGGQDYNIPTTFIRNDPYLISIFQKNNNLILDGEIYKHGWTLSKISGICRSEKLISDMRQLNFYCYDIVDENKNFTERLKILKTLKNNSTNDTKLIIVPHTKVINHHQIMKMHNFWVSKGYEGLVIRDPTKNYKCNSRDRRMQKIKIFTDDEFKITGIFEGLREEDMCFWLETKEGYPFKAKPIGTREDKQEYRKNINNIIGKMGTVKFFGYTHTTKPVPNLPVFKSIRLDQDK